MNTSALDPIRCSGSDTSHADFNRVMACARDWSVPVCSTCVNESKNPVLFNFFNSDSDKWICWRMERASSLEAASAFADTTEERNVEAPAAWRWVLLDSFLAAIDRRRWRKIS